MSFQPGASVNTVAFGNRPENVEVPHLDVRIPNVNDVNYPIGKRWIDVGVSEYVLLSQTSIGGILQANWALLGATGGALNTLTGNSGGAISPSAGNINIIGSAPITVAGSGSTLTISFSGVVPVANGGTGDSTLTAHSVLIGEGTSPVAFAGPNATSGIALISQGVSADPIFGTVVVAGGGTGATTLTGVLTGNGTSAITANAVTQFGVLVGGAANAVSSLAVAATGTVLVGNAGANPSFSGSPSVSGSLTAATTITATLGAITATNGNLVLGTAGNKLSIATGSNASVGVTGVMAGTPGTVTVATTACTTSSVIVYSRATAGGTLGNVSISAQSNGSFTLTSTGNETSTFNYLIIN